MDPSEVELVDWLLGDWVESGPRVVVLEGFSGLGKTAIGRRLASSWSVGAAVMVTATPESGGLEEVLFEIASLLESAGVKTVAEWGGGDFRAGLLQHLRDPNLLIIDQFESLVHSSTVDASFASLLEEIGAKGGRGRVLILTNQAFDVSAWASPPAVRTIEAPPSEVAVTFLQELLRERAVEDEVPTGDLPAIVQWLGRNRRAMSVFVACLRDEPLDQVLSLDDHSNDIRDGIPSPAMIRRLEAAFLQRLMGHLDSDGLLLLESLSILRRPFTIDAVRELAPQGVNVDRARSELQSRFILGRSRRWYTIHPVARQLSLQRVGVHRRLDQLHKRAADFHVRRVRVDGHRSLIRAGNEFVEARYHLIRSSQEEEFFSLAAKYRRLLQSNYSNVRIASDSDEAAALDMVPILLAALDGETLPLAQMRTLLARLLVKRARPGDSVLALRHLTVATQEAKERLPWLLRAELTGALETPRALMAVGSQAVERIDSESAASVVVRCCELLVKQGLGALALDLVNSVSNDLELAGRRRIFTLAAFLLTRMGRRLDAIHLLKDAYEEVGIGEATGYRLWEQACFLSFQEGSQEFLEELERQIVANGMNEHQPSLCRVLRLQLRGDFDAVVREGAQHFAYPAIAGQVAFVQLCLGDPVRAVETLDGTQFVPNPANWWVRGLASLCLGARANYLECMGQVARRPLTEVEMANPMLWLDLWANVPDVLGIYPSFYYPRLPSALTQLDFDLLPHDVESAASVGGLEAIALPLAFDATNGEAVPEEVSPAAPIDGRSQVNIRIETGSRKMGDTYNVSGQAGAVGRGAQNSGSRFVQLDVAQHEQLLAEIREMSGWLDRQGWRDAAVTVGKAEAAVEASDHEGGVAWLKVAGEKALDAALAVGANLATALITGQ